MHRTSRPRRARQRRRDESSRGTDVPVLMYNVSNSHSTYLCPHGHRLPERRSLFDPVNFPPEACPECYRTLSYPLCEYCGLPRVGYRSWRAREHETKAQPLHDFCPRCQRLYPEPRNWVLRADLGSTLSSYEMELASYLEAAPKLQQYKLTPDDVKERLPLTWLQKNVFGGGVLVSDPRHPKHANWQAYQTALLGFSGVVIAKRQAAYR